MSLIAFDGRWLVHDSLAHHFGITRQCELGDKMTLRNTPFGRAAVFGAGVRSLVLQAAEHTLLSCGNGDFAAIVLPAALREGIAESSCDIGMVVRDERHGMLVYSLERGRWNEVQLGKAACGEGWEWAMCRMVSAADNAAQAVECVARHNYCVSLPLHVVDMTGTEGPRLIEKAEDL